MWLKMKYQQFLDWLNCDNARLDALNERLEEIVYLQSQQEHQLNLFQSHLYDFTKQNRIGTILTSLKHIEAQLISIKNDIEVKKRKV